VVVSKEEVDVGRKGSGGAWGSTSRNGPAPQNGRIRALAKKTSEKVDRWDVGCSLVVLKMTCSQSGCEVQTHFLEVLRPSALYGWTGQQSGSGFINLAPSILHYNWF
jgi:hypothetical protein